MKKKKKKKKKKPAAMMRFMTLQKKKRNKFFFLVTGQEDTSSFGRALSCLEGRGRGGVDKVRCNVDHQDWRGEDPTNNRTL